MPQAIPLAVVGILKGLGVGAIGQLIGGIAASYLAGKLVEKDPDTLVSSGTLVTSNTCSRDIFLKLVYGSVLVGGNDVFIESLNSALWIVQTLAEGECSGIKEDAEGPLIWLDDKRIQKYDSNYVSYTFHSGTNYQNVDTELHAALPKWADTLRNTCYIVWKFIYNKDAIENEDSLIKGFTSVPDRKLVLDGKVLYDYRTDETSFSNNLALIFADFYTNSRYGLGESIDDLDILSINEVADYCDTKSWLGNFAFCNNEKVKEILDSICKAFRGTFIRDDGKIYLKYTDLDDEPVSMNITDDHIAVDDSGKSLITISQPSTFSQPKCLRIFYVDPDRNYISDEFIIGECFGLIEDVDLSFCFKVQAKDLALYYLERQLWQLSCQITLRDDAIQLLPHDIVSLSSTALGISEQLMRVLDVSFLPESGLCNINLIYERSELYNKEFDISSESVYECNLPDPKMLPDQVTNISFSESNYILKDKTYVRLRISWQIPTTYLYIKHVEVWISRDGVNFYHLVTANDYAYLDPTEKGEILYFKFLPINIWDTKRPIENCYAHSYTVTGKIGILPSDILSFNILVVGDTVHLVWTASFDDKDIIGYEIRYGNTWTHSIFVLTVQASSKVLIGIKPGTHTLLIKAKDALGQYSGAEKSAIFKIYGSPGYTQKYTWTDDYSIVDHGTHYGTEYYNDIAYGLILRVARGDDVNLSGYWESRVHDIGSIKPMRFWIIYSLAWFDAATSSWRWLFNDDETKKWTDVINEDDTWTKLFNAVMPGNVHVIFYWSDDQITWQEADGFEILSMEVEAKYVKYRIYLEDYAPESRIAVDDVITLKGYFWQ